MSATGAPRGQTAAQKIIARAAGRARVEAGEYVTVTPDATVSMELNWPVQMADMARTGIARLPRPDKAVIVVDHTTSAAMGSAHHQSHKRMREFCAEQGIMNFFGPGTGMRHLLLAERGIARPGTLIFGDEQNIASIGALGALCIPISREVLIPLLCDESWVQVPRGARFTLTGRLPFGVSGRDLAQVILRDFGPTDRLLQCAAEFVGEGVSALSLDERQGVLACLYHAGADTALMALDAAALDYVRERAAGCPFTAVEADADAEYAVEVTYDLSALSPMVTVPPEVHGGVEVGAVAGRPINQATIGSCAGNRLDDMRAAAAVLRGRRVAEGVTLYITPGSREVYANAAREGLLETFAEAGATVLAPGCTTCWGYQGQLADGEVLISSNQFNYTGRNGSRSAEIYLAGPYAVAAAAVAGQIIDPRELLDGSAGGAA
ncbi:aconitase family protein [Roseomonas sp. BN140053]|uniref:aconitase family protein n=1 Tax=Roseomonas sp. BN140053 TaxID=3391898 RepID=UPI0039EA9305